MLSRCTLGAIFALLCLGSWALTKPAVVPSTTDGDAKRVSELIKQLGSSKFQERNAAQKELEAIGSAALELLRKAVQTEDLETSKRAAELVRKLEEKMLTANILAPKRVRLRVEDKTVPQAVEELARLSGYQILIQGDRTKINDKKISLDTGDVSFWEALDQLCNKAGLVEQVSVTPVYPPNRVIPNPPVIRPAPPIKLKKGKVQPLPAPADNVPEKGAAPKAEPKQEEARAEPAAVVAAVAVALAQDPKPGVQPAKAEPGKAEPAKADAVQGKPVQAKPVQAQVQPIQIQIQPGPIQIMPVAPGARVPGIAPIAAPNQIVLVPGTPTNQHVSYAGAVRIRAIPPSVKTQGQHVVTLQVSAEPRLQGFTLVGTPTIERALDDQGQTLTLTTGQAQQNPNGPQVQIAPAMDIAVLGRPVQGQRQITLNFKAGEKQATQIKELKGTLTAQVLTPPEALMTIDNVVKAAGQTAKGKDGGSLQLVAIEKQANGDYKVQVRVEMQAGQNVFGGGIIIGNGVQIQQIGNAGWVGPVSAAGSGMPELVDAKGNKYQLVQMPSRRLNVNNGVISQEMTLVFRANNGQGEPASLVVTGTRMTSITIPFAFQNIPVK